jgi:hypothetical protein
MYRLLGQAERNLLWINLKVECLRLFRAGARREEFEMSMIRKNSIGIRIIAITLTLGLVFMAVMALEARIEPAYAAGTVDDSAIILRDFPDMVFGTGSTPNADCVKSASGNLPASEYFGGKQLGASGYSSKDSYDAMMSESGITKLGDGGFGGVNGDGYNSTSGPNYVYLKAHLNKTIRIIKKGFKTNDPVGGIEGGIACDLYLEFTPEELSYQGMADKTPALAIDMKHKDTRFHMINIKRLKVEMGIVITDSRVTKGDLDGNALHVTIGWGDIDNSQECWANEDDMTGTGYLNNKYWYGDNVESEKSEKWLKFISKLTGEETNAKNSSAVIGMHIKGSKDSFRSGAYSATFKFVSPTKLSYFSSDFDGNPLAVDPYAADIDYTLTDANGKNIKDANGENLVWSSGGSAKKTQESYYGKPSLTALGDNIKATSTPKTTVVTYAKMPKTATTDNEVTHFTKNSTTTWTESEFAGQANPYKGWLVKKTLGTHLKGEALFHPPGSTVYTDWGRDGDETITVYPKMEETKQETKAAAEEIPIPKLELSAADMGMGGKYSYRTKTDVIFAVKLSETSGKASIPDTTYDKNARVKVKFDCGTLKIDEQNVVVPAGKSQLVWVKFHIPENYGNFDIKVTATFTYMPITASTTQAENGNTTEVKAFPGITKEVTKTFPVSVTDVIEAEPPDTTATGEDGKPIKKPSSYNADAVMPSFSATNERSWVRYTYNTSTGKFVETTYSATLFKNSMSIKAGELVKTAKDEGMTIKSGYPFDVNIDTQIAGDSQGNVANIGSTTWITPIQTGRFLFPEFNYTEYDRIAEYLDPTSLEASASPTTMHFRGNRFNRDNAKIHYTPLWFPNGPYKVYCHVRDAWTPAGELSANLSAEINIQGNVFDDWHIAPER